MTSERLTRARRVTRRADYQRVLGNAPRTHGRFFTLVVAPNTLGRVRLGMVASRKLGNAVKRNLAKRLIREIFRRSDRTASGVSLDVVVIPRPALFTADFSSLQEDFDATLRRGARPRADGPRRPQGPRPHAR
jgi:ribonuclease P protein component